MAEDMEKKNQHPGQQSGQGGQQGGRGNQPGQSQQGNQPGQGQSGQQQDKKGGQFGDEEDDQNRDRQRRAS